MSCAQHNNRYYIHYFHVIVNYYDRSEEYRIPRVYIYTRKTVYYIILFTARDI